MAMSDRYESHGLDQGIAFDMAMQVRMRNTIAIYGSHQLAWTQSTRWT